MPAHNSLNALRIRSPVSPLFSGWNWVPYTRPARTAPVWVPLEDRVQLALLLAKGYAALDSRPYGGSLALALYPLKETE